MHVIRKIIIGIVVLLLVLTLAFRRKLFGEGYTPTFTAENGEAWPNSIALLEEIPIGGVEQWLLIRGHSLDNPILLWLHGGPGSSQMPITHAYDSELEKEFIVVHWDQRGAGKSNPSYFDESTMTYEQFISDAHQVTLYLKERFGKDKIYLLGHSWGTQIGLPLAARYPDDYHAYIGVSQVVHQEMSQGIAYEWLALKMQKSNKLKDLEILEGLGHPPYNEHDDFITFIRLVDAYKGSYDIPFFTLARIALSSTEYTIRDMFAWMRGSYRGSGPMWSEQAYKEYNAIQQFPVLQVPVYFFQGSHDYNTPLRATIEYFELLQCPAGKQLLIFESSAHTPFLGEPEAFQQALFTVKKEIQDNVAPQ